MNFRKHRTLTFNDIERNVMTLKECYWTIGDYQDAMTRLLDEDFMRRVLKKFVEDDSMEHLEVLIKNGNISEAFETAHALKGVVLNLGLTRFGGRVSEVTEVLRRGGSPDEELLEVLKSDYDMTVSRIKEGLFPSLFHK